MRLRTSSFDAAYAAMQESLRNNNATINTMQGQIQLLCNTISNPSPPPGWYNTLNNPNKARAVALTVVGMADKVEMQVVIPTTPTAVVGIIMVAPVEPTTTAAETTSTMTVEMVLPPFPMHCSSPPPSLSILKTGTTANPWRQYQR